jgi:light-regulated signal transduction histidine kinase (bacteriophytochrome)
MAAAGPRAWPLRAFRGSSARARLLRAFLPPTTAALLLASAAGRTLTVSLHVNPALAAALSTLAALALVSALVWRVSGTVGRTIDEAKEGLTRSRNQLEHAVELRTAELARINQELDAFTSSVSHDLRAPLRHMVGFANLLDQTAREQLSPQAHNYVRRIVESGERMTRLIEDLLMFARTAQTPLRAARVELLPMIDDVMHDLNRDLHGRVIEWDVQPLPAVRGDGALLRQAFANVLGNAVKYTKTRSRARIEIGTTRAAVHECVVYVRDNGVGFDAAYAHKLFGVFQRLHTADEFEGTGIGLANVRRIIERHGGRTWAEGAIDKGATFFISLPAEGTPVT